MKVFSLFLIVLVLQHVHASTIIGIDLGTENMKVSIAKPGKVDIALDESSSRKSPSLLGFDTDRRVFGEHAANLMTRSPHYVFKNPFHFLGKGLKSLNDPWFTDAKSSQSLYWLENAFIDESDPESDRELKVILHNKTFTMDVVISQILRRAQGIAAHYMGEIIRDVAVTVPAFYSHSERNALLNAAKIGGLNVISLVDEGLAVAVQFCSDKQFETPKKVLFFDLGASNLQVALYEFSNQVVNNKSITNIKHIANDWSIEVGGREIEKRIAEYWIQELLATGKLKGSIKPQTMIKLLAAAKKAKEILSVNKETHAFVEDVTPGLDLNTLITKDTMEALCLDIWMKIEVFLNNFVKKNNMTMNEIDDIQLFGAGTRVPKVQEIIAKVYGHEPSKQLNTDESAVIGAALYAAEVSGQYRVKFKSKQGTSLYLPVEFVRKSIPTGDEKEEVFSSVLFNRNTHYGTKKIVKIPTERDSIIDMHYAEDSIVPGISRRIGQYMVTGLDNIHSRFNVTGNITVHYRVELTHSGTIELKSANAHVPIITQKVVKVKKAIEKTEEKPEVNTTEKLEENSTQKFEENSAEKAKEDTENVENVSENKNEDEPVSQDENTKDNEQTQEATEEPKEEYEEVIQETKTTKVLSLKIKSLTDEYLLKTMKSKQSVIDQIEKEEMQRLESEKSRNTLESTLYSIRDQFDSEVMTTFATAEERESINQLITRISEWLEEEGDKQPKEVYDSKMEEIQAQFKDIAERYKKALEETLKPPASSEQTQDANVKDEL